MQLDDIARRIREHEADYGRRYGVTGFWVFGSRARGDAHEESDLDLLVEFGRKDLSLYDFAGLNLELEDLLGMKVDLVERHSLRPEISSRVLPEAIPI